MTSVDDLPCGGRGTWGAGRKSWEKSGDLQGNGRALGVDTRPGTPSSASAFSVHHRRRPADEELKAVVARREVASEQVCPHEAVSPASPRGAG